MIHLGTFFTALLGFALLLAAMSRHQQDWLKRKLPADRSRLLRLSGFVALALSFVLAGLGFGWAYGAVAWSGWLTAAAALIVTANTNRDRILARLRR
jgi:fatty acid desaturase